MAEAIGSLKGIARDTATLIAAAIYEGGINEPRFLRDIDAADTLEVLQDFEALKTKRFLTKTMASAIRNQFRTASPKKSPQKSVAVSEHTATSSAVAISLPMLARTPPLGLVPKGPRGNPSGALGTGTGGYWRELANRRRSI